MIQDITAWVQFAAEVLIFAGVAYNTMQSCLTNRKLRKVHATAADTNSRMVAVEVATNGMRNDLVAAAKKEGFLRGKVVGAEGERQKIEDDGA